MKIFIHHDGALGDVLLSLRCLSRLRQDADFIHLAARSDVAELLRLANIVDDSSTPGSALYASCYAGNPDRRIRELLAGYDRAYVFTGSDDPPLARALSGLVPSVRVIRTLPPAGTRQHVAAFRLDQLGNSGTVKEAPSLHIPEQYVSQARTLCSAGRYTSGAIRSIVLHPGSGGRRKCWPLERYLELAERLHDGEDADILLLSGPAEEGTMTARLAAFAAARSRVRHLQNLPLPVLAALFSLISLMIGNDSGITHLAAVCGCRTVALFGPTDPALWKPLGPRVVVLRDEQRTDGPPAASVGDVIAALSQLLPSHG